MFPNQDNVKNVLDLNFDCNFLTRCSRQNLENWKDSHRDARVQISSQTNVTHITISSQNDITVGYQNDLSVVTALSIPRQDDVTVDSTRNARRGDDRHRVAQEH